MRKLLLIWGLGLLFALLGAGGTALLPNRAEASPDAQRAEKKDSNISSIIRKLLKEMRTRGVTRATVRAMRVSALSVEGLVKVDENGRIHTYILVLNADKDQLRELERHEVLVELVNDEANIVQGWVPFDRLEQVARLGFVRRIQPPTYALVRSGSRNTEGDVILRANLARSQFGIAGAGVKVGVISDGVDSLAVAQVTEDLPPGIELDPKLPGSGDEGTAMLEIVHDLAPAAQLAFSGPETSLEMVQSVDFLSNRAFGGAGADIVVDDLGFYLEPFFEDGLIAQAVQTVVSNGTVYVSSAGNDAGRHYEADYVAVPDGFHDFGGGDVALTMSVAGQGETFAVLQWNDPFGSSDNDYDLYICPAGAIPFDASCSSSEEVQNGGDDPLEYLYIENTSSSPNTYDIFIHRYSATRPGRLEMFILGPGYMEEFITPDGSIFGHPAVPGAIATGAISASDPENDTIESFSSRGPADVFFPSFRSRPKPNVAAIDGVSVTGAGGFPNTFYGTSAAAPHVAGVAALMLEALRDRQPGLSRVAAQMRVLDALQSSAVDLGDAGFDQTFGAGRIDALAAVEWLIEEPVPVPSLSTWGLLALGAGFALLFAAYVRRQAPLHRPDME